MRKFILFCLCILGHLMVQGQTNCKEKIAEIEKNANDNNVTQLLEEWESSDNSCPEVYYFLTNIYTKLARPSYSVGIIYLFDLMNNTILDYNDTLMQKALTYIDKGVREYPDLVELRVSKVKTYRLMKKYDLMTEEAINVIKYPKNSWKNLVIPLPEGIFEEPTSTEQSLFNMLSECYSIYAKTNEQSMLKNNKELAEVVLLYYPDHEQSLIQLVAYYIMIDDKKSINSILPKLEKLSEQSTTMTMSLSLLYAKIGNQLNALKYLKLVLENPDIDDSRKQSTKEDVMNLLYKESN